MQNDLMVEEEEEEIWEPDSFEERNRELDRMFGYDSEGSDSEEEDAEPDTVVQPEQLENVTSAPKQKTKKGSYIDPID